MRKIIKLYRKLLSFLSKSERKDSFKLLGLIVLMALMDAIGVASIMPFMTIVTDQQSIQSNKVLNNLFTYFDFESPVNFIWFIGILVLVFLIIALGVKSYTNYKLLRFVAIQEYTIGSRLFEKYLTQDYTWHINNNSSELGKNILSEVSAVIGTAMIPMMNLISHGTITLAIILMLMYTDVMLSILVGLGLGSVYIVIYLVIKSYLERIGKERFESNSNRYFIVNEAFRAIKVVKIESLEKVFVERFKEPSLIFARNQSSAQILSMLPRYGMEAVAFGGIIVATLFLMNTTGGVITALPMLSLFAFAGYKIMPSLQAIFNAITQLKYTTETVENLYEDYNNLKINKKINKKSIQFKNDLMLKGVCFSYENNREILKQVSMKIKKNTYVTIIGKTGCGKSTLTDIIMGLIRPSSGCMYIDNKILDDELYPSWRSQIGYVPQQIALTDSTLLNNIALGEDDCNIDLRRVQEVVEISCLADVVKGFDNGLHSRIGEGGVKLSGGQKQRIGIARALYKNPTLLILDEATSAMDSKTESLILEAINKMKSLTTISVTHRLSTIKNCDKVFIIEDGSVVKSGPYYDVSRAECFKNISVETN